MYSSDSAAGLRRALIRLSWVDTAIIAIYFLAVLAIGFYLKEQTKTGEDFFLAGREMTAWIAGLAFLSANLGALELMGWAAASYQYGILATHWYWIGAIPAMLFLGDRDDAVLLHQQDSLGARLSEASFRRTGPGALGHQFRLHDGADERHQHVLHGAGDEGRSRLGHQFQHLDFVADGRRYTWRSGGLRSAIFNEVLQFVLIWLGVLLIPILGLKEAGGWSGLQQKHRGRMSAATITRICGARWARSRTTPWAFIGPASCSVWDG